MKTLRAAIFCRKSTQQAAVEAAPGDRQAALATTFATSKGWEIAATFIDDGVSGRARTKLIGRAKVILAAEDSGWLRSPSRPPGLPSSSKTTLRLAAVFYTAPFPMRSR